MLEECDITKVDVLGNAGPAVELLQGIGSVFISTSEIVDGC
jgi:hypothetical protein